MIQQRFRHGNPVQEHCTWAQDPATSSYAFLPTKQLWSDSSWSSGRAHDRNRNSRRTFSMLPVSSCTSGSSKNSAKRSQSWDHTRRGWHSPILLHALHAAESGCYVSIVVTVPFDVQQNLLTYKPEMWNKGQGPWHDQAQPCMGKWM